MSQPMTMKTSDSDSEDKMNTSHRACAAWLSRVRLSVKGNASRIAMIDAMMAYQNE